MKKLFYVIILTVIAGMSLSSCTEEVIKPKAGGTGAGIKE